MPRSPDLAIFVSTMTMTTTTTTEPIALPLAHAHGVIKVPYNCHDPEIFHLARLLLSTVDMRSYTLIVQSCTHTWPRTKMDILYLQI